MSTIEQPQLISRQNSVLMQLLLFSRRRASDFLYLFVNVLLILLSVPLARGTQWTVKSYAVLSPYVKSLSYITDAYTYNKTIYLSSLSSTPTASPFSSTITRYFSEDVTYITYYLPPGAVAQAVIASATADSSDPITFTDFYMPIEYTAPASCPSVFTYTTSTAVYVPAGAESQVTPTCC